VVAPATGLSVDYVADSAISDRLETEFRFDPVVPFNTIDVRTAQGVVTLTGWVTNLLAKERATRTSESLRGVLGYDIEIKVTNGMVTLRGIQRPLR
jgi:osmotically-inducible protein OsmY